MKILFRSVTFKLCLAIILAIFIFPSCEWDDDDDDGDDKGPHLGEISSDTNFLFYYHKDSGSWFTSDIGTTLGSHIDSGAWNRWSKMAGVQVGKNNFVVGHQPSSLSNLHEYFIQRIEGNGLMGDETDRDKWHNDYDTLFGFSVGNRGFLFGQITGAASNNRRWFVQEISSGGVLTDNESDSGTWQNSYETFTPLYVNEETYLYFHSTHSDNIWFITHVSQNGTLSDDVDGGNWDSYWTIATSYELDGKTYLVGCRDVNWTGDSWFIQRINSDGTMGEETDRGDWSSSCHSLVGFESNGHAYLFGETNSKNYFIQEVTADGKMGNEVDNGTMGYIYDFIFPYPKYDSPNSFRYTIGWDITSSSGGPTAWSPLYNNPWGGEMKFGGGAAIADIDGDSNHEYDAVLVGIDSVEGDDKFYYKVAFNLDSKGKAASWSDTFYSPLISFYQAGGGADIADIDGNGKQDLLLMYIDAPDGANAFHYIIGWNLDKDGAPTGWSNNIKGPNVGDSTAGGGAAIADIDKNGRPDLLFMAIDDPEGSNHYWYTIGKNLNTSGAATEWTPHKIDSHELGYFSAGGGAAFTDLNDNGKFDLVLMNLDSPEGENEFWCRVGYDIDINGVVSSWKNFTGPQPGWIQSGGGAAIADIDKNGTQDLLLLAIDNPYGGD